MRFAVCPVRPVHGVRRSTRAPDQLGADESMAFVLRAGPGRCGGRRRWSNLLSSALGSLQGAQPSTSSPPARNGCFDACKGVHLL